ncbi:translation initiation factor IF-2 [candidate division WWE3 bacterium RIFCSPHIGHO2_01_FULL_40_23]|uniref:Translation initiation factor IF-2 n=1 Tax=candidate division WWE3 bacterium RIFCSPLOWO2_01_FULL_41_18 TaxID=1802625 RepID=A0A1F4VE14_UNCKA|nr:MAG: translation initiation factor IF-2 [candidate division WWE3 bacterium RIFCSPHIGHO2_01_FULL_40_23]OGC55218.1 MAG: translation initiation factor IF-2 [candidate division WWE3 bacterium RIFCSPLOWO2_01_FULL_41_18]
MKKESALTSKKEYPFIRPPVVAVMGHVDHGKTSLLDYIRKSKVAEGEHGGITQKIGAYQVIYKDRKITFIDTPGHEAFAKMRGRGGKVSDIVILVVSGDDGVMPQTKEAISHAKAANSQIIVAINKMDLPQANPDKVKQQLAENEVLVEGFGGDVICVPVSAKTGLGVDKLLDSILALSEILELKADPKGDLEGVIIESKLDAKKGPLFTAIIKNGTLKVGDEIYTYKTSGKVRSLFDFTGTQVKDATPSDPIEVLGFPIVPPAGEVFVSVKNKDLLDVKKETVPEEEKVLDSTKVINLILKADAHGSLEALEGSLKKLETPEARLKFLHKATGDISESDVLLAHSSKGLIFGFNTKVPSKVLELADSMKVTVRAYTIIYKLLDEVESLLKEVLFKEEVKVKGRAEVLKVFPLESGDIVAGCKVLGGALRQGAKISIFRESAEEPIFTAKIKHLRRGKEEVNVVGKDVECGVLLNPIFKDIKVKDIIEVL